MLPAGNKWVRARQLPDPPAARWSAINASTSAEDGRRWMQRSRADAGGTNERDRRVEMADAVRTQLGNTHAPACYRQVAYRRHIENQIRAGNITLP
jgi:hypothetical protein